MIWLMTIAIGVLLLILAESIVVAAHVKRIADALELRNDPDVQRLVERSREL